MPWIGLKGTIDNNHELYQVWCMHNQKKYIKIVFDMEIISLNIHNFIKRRLFEDDIEDVATDPN